MAGAARTPSHPGLTPHVGSPATLASIPVLSRDSWLAAHHAAERAIPVLIANGFAESAVLLARRSKQFAERAG